MHFLVVVQLAFSAATAGILTHAVCVWPISKEKSNVWGITYFSDQTKSHVSRITAGCTDKIFNYGRLFTLRLLFSIIFFSQNYYV
nr:PREDICTED: uncharacterized protein LOC105663183 isoform X4 [Megachile rotundata]